MKRIYTFLAAIMICTSGLFAQLIINEVLYDPSNNNLEGDANGDGSYDQTEDEFIEFFNDGASNFDLSGYQVWDDTASGGVVYTFPSGTVIPPKGALVLFGGGTPVGAFGGAIVLADTGDGLSLNNSGEIIMISDGSGTVILSFDSDAESNNPNESFTRSPDITGSFARHPTVSSVLFSPGTKLDGSSFDTTLAVDVTFSVDMSRYASTILTVYVRGSYNSWCEDCNPMSDIDGDGVWETTIPITQDSIEYLFLVDGVSGEEEFASVQSCIKNVNGWKYRFSLISGNTILPTSCFESCDACIGNEISLKGILDFSTPDAGVTGKAIHVIVDSAIANLNIYGIGVANNGGGTDGEEYTFPNVSVAAGDNILVVRDSQAIANYFGMCWSEFDYVFVDEGGSISQNGDDAIELFRANTAVEVYGDVDVDGSGEAWEYLDAWAYKADTGWMVAPINSTDGTTTIYDSESIYPICPAIMVTSISVEGEDDATSIDELDGTLQMVATSEPLNAEDSTLTWSVDDEMIATIDANGLLTAVANGEVVVTATANDADGVTGSATITVSNQTNSVTDVNLAQVKVYPNPAQNNITITAETQIDAIRIYSLSGSLVHALAYTGTSINISHLQSGVYFIAVQTGDVTSRVRFIKK